jgi:hypothetical protein
MAEYGAVVTLTLDTGERLNVRLPQGLKGALEEAAKASSRKLGGQCSHYLIRGLVADGFLPDRTPDPSSIESLGLPEWIRRKLTEAGIGSVAALVRTSRAALSKLGADGIREVEAALSVRGLELA